MSYIKLHAWLYVFLFRWETLRVSRLPWKVREEQHPEVPYGCLSEWGWSQKRAQETLWVPGTVRPESGLLKLPSTEEAKIEYFILCMWIFYTPSRWIYVSFSVHISILNNIFQRPSGITLHIKYNMSACTRKLWWCYDLLNKWKCIALFRRHSSCCFSTFFFFKSVIHILETFIETCFKHNAV